jgi:beta-alanine--pyruvate transaminase
MQLQFRERPTLYRGDGCELWDIEGQRFLDGMASATNAPFGHANTVLRDAITTQLDRLAHFEPSSARMLPAEQLAAALAQVSPPSLDHFVFVNSGSEATEAAIRAAIDYWCHAGQPHRKVIIAFERGYHGTTALAQSLSGMPAFRSDWGVGLQVVHVQLGPEHHPKLPSGADALRAAFTAAADRAGPSQVAAVIVEPFLNVGGGIVLPGGILSWLRVFADQIGCLLIIDEVFTGFGRAGSFFASTASGATPDILTMSKGMTGGYIPMGAAAISARIYDAFHSNAPQQALRYGHTTSGHAVGCAAALAAIKLLKDEVIQSAASTAIWLAQNFAQTLECAPAVKEARIFGATGVIELASEIDAQNLTKRALKAGLFVRCQGTAVMLIPALTVSESQLEEMTKLLYAAAYE